MIGSAVLLAAALTAQAQPTRATPTGSSPVPREDGVRWQSLAPAQREALAPLERDWPGIDAPRKQKWIALAGRFKTLSPDERSRITARMAEWAKLTPAERGQARIRFEEARQVPAPDRSARWQAYQALPPEQRQLLAARAASAAAAGRATTPWRRPPGRCRATARKPSSTCPTRPSASRPSRSRRPWSRPRPGATTTLITRGRRRPRTSRRHAKDRGDAGVRESLDPLAAARAAGCGGRRQPDGRAASVEDATGCRRRDARCAAMTRGERGQRRDLQRSGAERRRWPDGWPASSTRQCCCSARP